jgi:hypothetical protein
MTELWLPSRHARPRDNSGLAPQSELDSQLRDFLCRIVEQHGPVTISMTDERLPGSIRWQFGATPVSAKEATIWFEPE